MRLSNFGGAGVKFGSPYSLAAILFVIGLLSAVILRDKSMLIMISMAIFCAVLGIRIAWRGYIVIQGTCCEVDATVIRKRTKTIVLSTKMDGIEAKLRIPLRQQFKKFAVGDPLEIHVDAAAKIYEWDGEFRLQSYISVDKQQSP